MNLIYYVSFNLLKKTDKESNNNKKVYLKYSQIMFISHHHADQKQISCFVLLFSSETIPLLGLLKNYSLLDKDFALRSHWSGSSGASSGDVDKCRSWGIVDSGTA